MAFYEKVQNLVQGEITYSPVATHDLSSAIHFFLLGRISRTVFFARVANVVDTLGTDANGNMNDGLELNSIQTAYNAKNATNKVEYLDRIQKVLLLSERNAITKTEYLGLMDL